MNKYKKYLTENVQQPKRSQRRERKRVRDAKLRAAIIASTPSPIPKLAAHGSSHMLDSNKPFFTPLLSASNSQKTIPTVPELIIDNEVEVITRTYRLRLKFKLNSLCTGFHVNWSGFPLATRSVKYSDKRCFFRTVVCRIACCFLQHKNDTSRI